MIRLYAVSILPLKDEACFMDCYMRSVQERRDKADELKMPADKARCIAAGLLLAYAYKKFREEYIKELAKANSFGYAVIAEEMPEIKAEDNGKPYFVYEQDTGTVPVYFNVSHSGNYVICVMADKEVGADIQRATHVRDVLIRRFFTQEEKERLEACGEDEELRRRCFAGLWATKEAEAKLSGRGIGQLLEKVVANVKGIPSSKEEKRDNIGLWQGMIGEYAYAVTRYVGTDNPEDESVQLCLVDEGELFYG